MRTFFQYSKIYDNVVYDDKAVKTVGISYYPDFYQYKNYYKTLVIVPKFQFRPDKIAYSLWNNQYLTWVLDAINNFHHVSEYYIGRSIYYLEDDFLTNLGIL